MPVEALQPRIEIALRTMESTLDESSPFLAREVLRWIRRISPDGDPTAHFTHPRMFPILLLPEFVLESLALQPNTEFQQALVESSVNGYLHIRVIDDLVDGDRGFDLERSILPAAGVFCSQFQSPYQRYFAYDHPFWEVFRSCWTRSAESAARDASMSDVTWLQFEGIGSHKFSAAGIPVAAACFHYGRPDLVAEWLDLTYRLGRWSQMLDDILDWHVDYSAARATYFLSEGLRRRYEDESIEEWMLREGCRWGFDLLEEWLDELQQKARGLGSSRLRGYLDLRKGMLREQRSALIDGLGAIGQLAAILQEQR